MLNSKELKAIAPKSLAILGGTFDPIHNGHLYVCDQVLKKCNIEYLALLPAKRPPHKNENEISHISHRVAMVELAAIDNPTLIVLDIDLREGRSYSVDTLKILKELLPNTRIYLIMGGDSLMYVEQWYKSHELFKLATIPVVYRPGDEIETLTTMAAYLTKQYGADIMLIECEGMDISSSEIRDMVKNNMNIEDFVPQKVSQYIAKENLYSEE